MPEKIAVLMTASSIKEGRKIAAALVKNRLVACVNIAGGLESLFWWSGKVDSAKEILLIAKTRSDKLNKVIKLVKSLHSYDVPEIIALPVCGGSKTYLDWIDESLR